MKTRNAIYWATTGLLAAAFTFGGVADLARLPSVMDAVMALGYPAYVATILGGWKLLGALAIVAPRFPRLKEWAYAGMFFDLTGAVASHLSQGDPLVNSVAPSVFLGLLMASWALRPEGRLLVATEAPNALALMAGRRLAESGESRVAQGT